MSTGRRRDGFTLIEVLIVVVIMAVLAATIIPQFSSSAKDAKESSLNFNLHTMRSQIELYKGQHNSKVPTDLGDATGGFLPQLTGATNSNGDTGAAGTNYPYGPYFAEVPVNPFNDDNSVVAGMGVAGDGSSGWQYDAATGRLWPNHVEFTP